MSYPGPTGPDTPPTITIPAPRWSSWAVPVLDTNAYAAGDALHVAPIEFPGLLKGPGFTTTLTGLIVEDSTATPQNIPLTLWLFDKANLTLPALNAAWTLVAGDREKLIACVSTDIWNTSTATGRAEVWGLSIPLRSRFPHPSASLYGVLQSLGAPTYTAASLRIRLIVQD
jgi:hypothetical protein